MSWNLVSNSSAKHKVEVVEECLLNQKQIRDVWSWQSDGAGQVTEAEWDVRQAQDVGTPHFEQDCSQYDRHIRHAERPTCHHSCFYILSTI